MQGNPFSPWYAEARRTDVRTASPFAHSALNVVLYGPNGRLLWTLTERSLAPAARGEDVLEIGASRVIREPNRVVVEVREHTAMMRTPVRGRIELVRESAGVAPWNLDPDGQHQWWLCMPRGRLHVDLEGLQFSGNGYHDANAGDVALEQSFRSWSWGRAHTENNRTIVSYSVDLRGGGERTQMQEIDPEGNAHEIGSLERRAIGRTAWGIARDTLADPNTEVQVQRTFEDTPFYARTLIRAQVQGSSRVFMHEQLSLERFETRWVQHLLKYRMGRASDATMKQERV
jgi:carotenoid 1,2-hydratase